MSDALQVMDAQEGHYAGWRLLWDAYCRGGLPEEISKATWARILDPGSAVGCLVAVLSGEVVGFVTYVTHECTWELTPVCYVEDVFVSKLRRGPALGVGFALRDELVGRLNRGCWSRLYGITRVENKVAQALYSTVASGQPYLRYVLKPNRADKGENHGSVGSY